MELAYQVPAAHQPDVPAVGGSLWGYGVAPESMKFSGRFWLDSMLPTMLPPEHLYVG